MIRERSDLTTKHAVGYLRRSTTHQEQSLDDQRREIERYAKENGFNVIRWYADDGISGATGDERPDFLRMLSDCENGKDFSHVLCYDLSRFGRMDNDEAGFYRHRFRKAGVEICYIAENFGADEEMNDIIRPVMQSQKRAFLRQLSRDTIRGQVTTVLRGFTAGKIAPYGYDRMLVDPSGRQVARLKYGERMVKPKDHKVTLVLGDPEKVEVVKWLFEMYSSRRVSLRFLADQLNRRGLPSARGGKWRLSAIREILLNPVYRGDEVWGRRSSGKFYVVQSGQAVKQESNHKRLVRNPEEVWTVKRDAYPAIVSREVWDTAVSRLHSHGQGKGATNRKGFPLGGLVYCGHCGGRMTGETSARLKNGRKYVYRKYACSTYKTQGPSQCKHYAVEDAPLTAFLIQQLRGLLMLDKRDLLRKKIREALQKKSEPGNGDTKALKERLGSLEAKIKTATRRYLELPEDLMTVARQELERFRDEQRIVAAQLRAVQAPEVMDVDTETEKVLSHVWELEKMLSAEESGIQKEVFSRFVDRITLHFQEKRLGKRLLYKFLEGVAVLKPLGRVVTLGGSGGGI